MKYLTKKNTLFIGFLFLILFFLIPSFYGEVCGPSQKCQDFFVGAIYVSFIVAILIIPLCLLVFLLPPIAFGRWKKFALWAVPILTFLIVWIEKTGSSGGLPGQFHPGLIFFPLIFAFYYAVSLTIILGAWYEAKTNKKPKWWQYLVLSVILAGICIGGFFGLVVLALR